MNNVSLYGWNELLFQQKQESAFNECMHGRILVTHKTCYEVVAENGIFTCELTGNMLYGRETSDYPCTGDWVLFQQTDADKGIIFDMLPRQKTLYRLKNGTVSEKQAIASHVDKGFIVQSLDNNFNVRRTERFVLQLSAENIQPVLVLTKTDLEFDKTEVETALEHLSRKLPVFYTSIQRNKSIDELRNSINEGETIVLIGSSGVGKSTLINALCKKEIQPTGAISTSTGKGRHTSTRREMILMEGFGVLIDTPGIKVFGVTSDNAENLSEMLDISDYAQNCRYKDCQHENEKGCAVIEALERGELDQGVYANYLKLKKEALHYNSSVHEKRKKEKSFSKMVKNVNKNASKK